VSAFVKRTPSEYVTVPPARRPLKIFSTDPMLGRTAGNRITIDVAKEGLNKGPAGKLVVVIDYDFGHSRFYPAVDLNYPAILMQAGLDPTESDPRFRQQMVYAVNIRTLENFDGFQYHSSRFPIWRFDCRCRANSCRRNQRGKHEIQTLDARCRNKPIRSIHDPASTRRAGQTLPGIRNSYW
jgi:hypothetical protein